MLVAENESLKKQLAETREELRDAREAIVENEMLRELIGLIDKHRDFVLESAKIIYWNPSNWSSSFTISKGSTHGIELGNCVVNESLSLVGQVSELGDTWATVRSVIDVELNVGVLVGEAGNAAMVVGDFALMNRGKTKLTYLTEGTQLLEGEAVLTSGKGDMFPQGLLIGIITSVETDGQFEYGVIEPDCDLSRRSQVFVIKEFDVTN
jgi:rod shape-determining protein MreC